jgi:hypothetical protein
MDEAHAEAEGLGVPPAFQVGEGQDELGFARRTPLHHRDGGAKRLQVLHRALHLRIAEGAGKALDLQGEVKLESKGSFVAEMARARVVLEDKAVDTDVPVLVTFDAGTINAQGMKITDDGKRILFFNGVKARFQQAPAGPSDGSTAP